MGILRLLSWHGKGGVDFLFGQPQPTITNSSRARTKLGGRGETYGAFQLKECHPGSTRYGDHRSRTVGRHGSSLGDPSSRSLGISCQLIRRVGALITMTSLTYCELRSLFVGGFLVGNKKLNGIFDSLTLLSNEAPRSRNPGPRASI